MSPLGQPFSLSDADNVLWLILNFSGLYPNHPASAEMLELVDRIAACAPPDDPYLGFQRMRAQRLEVIRKQVTPKIAAMLPDWKAPDPATCFHVWKADFLGESCAYCGLRLESPTNDFSESWVRALEEIRKEVNG